MAVTGSVQVASELVSPVSVARLRVLAVILASGLVGRMAVASVLAATVSVENELFGIEAVEECL